MPDQDALVIKVFGPLEIKDESRGEVEAEVASLDVVDFDRDVIRSKSIPAAGARVKLSFYGHAAAFGDAPVGKGVIKAVNGKAVLQAKYFLSTSRGREAFETVKELGADGEWSVGFHVEQASDPDETWTKQGARRMLDKIDLFEVSPVLRGASPGTRTMAVKSADAEPTTGTGVAVPGVTEVTVKDGDVRNLPEVDAEAQRIAAEFEAKQAEDAAALKAAEDAAAQQAADAEALRVAQADEAQRRAAEAEAKHLRETIAAEFERFQRTFRYLGAA